MVLSGARGEMARLRLVGKIVGIELADELGKRLGHFCGMLIAVARVFPLRPGELFVGHPVLRELFPHMRHVGGEVNVAAIFTAIDIRPRAAVRFGAGPPLQAVLARIARDAAAVGERQGFLQRHVDALAGAGYARMTNRGEANIAAMVPAI